MVNTQIKTTFFKEIPTFIPRERLPYAHNLIKRLFSLGELFSKTESLCKKVGASNKGSAYFRNREGISNSFFFSTPATAVDKGNSSQSERKIGSSRGDWKSLEKGCNRKSSYEKGFCQGQCVNNLFLVKNRFIFNLKNLNQYIHHDKMESQKSLTDILKQGNFMCKLDLKDTYFCIPIVERSKKFVRF